MSEKTISEWYPYEAKILTRMIKLKGGELLEADFDRIFGEMKRLDLGPGKHPRYKMTMRSMSRFYFGLTTRDSPVMGILQGLQQQFLYLAQDMYHEGKINVSSNDQGIVYSLP